jgi:hypothetical protein
MIPTSAYIKFHHDGVAAVDVSLRLTGSSFIRCHTYDGEPPILAVQDGHVSVSVTVPDRRDTVTPEDLDTARRLADAVAAYIAELEIRIAAQGSAAEGEAA